jgi:ABC-type sugar transport system substrate-binding protein
MHHHRLRISGIILLAALLMIAGCAKKNDASSHKRIAGIVFQEDQFFRLVLFGMRDAAKNAGVELLEANSAGRPDKEIQLVNTYIAQGVDAIVISPLSARASISALERARSKGITVITYNTTIEDSIPASFVESDQVELGASTGRAARAYIDSVCGGKATVALLGFLSQAPEIYYQRKEGFVREITKLPGVRVVAEQDAWLAEQAVKKAGDILTAHPDVNLIWAANEGGTVGAVMAVKNSGRTGRVAVFGTDASDQLADFLLAEEPVLQAVTGQQPFLIGTRSVQAALAALKKEPVEKKVSLPGLLLTRTRPDDVRRFKSELHTMLANDKP